MTFSSCASMDSKAPRLHPLGVPVALSVRVDGDGNPVEVREDRGGPEHGRNAAMQRGRAHGRRREPSRPKGVQVEAIQEIWQVDDEWWRTPLSRLYYRVVLENGRLMILFCDLLDGTWYRQ